MFPPGATLPEAVFTDYGAAADILASMLTPRRPRREENCDLCSHPGLFASEASYWWGEVCWAGFWPVMLVPDWLKEGKGLGTRASRNNGNTNHG